MKPASISSLCLSVLATLGLLFIQAYPLTAADDDGESVFRVGAATSVITSPLGEEIIGAFVPTPASRIHDELHARCLVLDDGKMKLAFVVCDLVGFHRSVAVEAKAFIESELGIPPSHVAISATHSHSATNALYKDDWTFESDSELTEYQHFVARRIADGVHRAVNLLRPAEMAYGHIDVPEHVFNRRWFMKEGTVPTTPFGTTDDQVKMNPPAGSPDLVKPAGPTDPRVSILAFREPDGKPIALYSSYSLHYVGGVNSGDVSADYYGYYCRAVERILGDVDQDPPFVAMMANGTSGDVNNINFLHPRERKPPYEHMREVAHDIADKVTAEIPKFSWDKNITLDARFREMDLKWRSVPSEKLEWAKKTEKELDPADRANISPLFLAHRVQMLAAASPETKFPIHAIRIGDVCIGMNGAETFAEMGMDFRKRSPFSKSFMVELTDGCYGYMPTERHYALGGYETWLSINLLEEKAATKVMEGILQMAEEMKTDRGK